MVKKFSFSTSTTLHSLLAIVTTLLLCLPTSAQAGADAPPPEAPPAQAPKPMPPENNVIMYGTPVGALHDAFFDLMFFQDPSVSENDFTIRLALRGTVSGCVHLQPGFMPMGSHVETINGTTTKFINDRMEIMLDVPVIALSDAMPRYSTSECETSHVESYVDIPVSRDKLIAKNISKFVFKTPKVDLGKFDIDLNKDRLIFKVKNPYAQIPEVWVTLWFYPENTIKLYVPGASSDTDVLKEIRDFGLAHGLVPMEDVLGGYKLPDEAKDYVYFIDPKRVFLRDLSPADNNKQIGEIAVTKTYQGPSGAYERMKPLAVFGNLVQEVKTW